MSSCSSSSNIRSQLFAPIIYQEPSGARISFNIDTSGNGYTIGSGITGGTVVRFNPTNLTYVPSNAKDADTAEVLGVVESLSYAAGVTVYTIVANGLINYPGITNVPDYYTYGGACDAQTTLSGGAGGKDIFFLSDGCTGSLQYLEPKTAGSIVKPVMQRLATSNYNAMVLNYIGYEVGEQAQAEFPLSGFVGSVVYVPSGSSIPFGFLNIENQILADVSDYSELYSIFGINYGLYQERVFFSNVSGIGTGTVTQSNGSSIISTGTVLSIDPTTNSVVIQKAYDQQQTNLSFNLNFTVGGFRTPTSVSVIKFTIPSTNTQNFTFNSSQSGPRTVTMIPAIKAKNDLSFVSITDVLKLQGLCLGSYVDVENTLDVLCADTGVC